MPNFYAFNTVDKCWEEISAMRWERLSKVQEKGIALRLAWMDDDVFLEANHDGPAQPGIVCDLVVHNDGPELIVQVVADNGQVLWQLLGRAEDAARLMAEALDVVADNEAILRNIVRVS